MDRALAPSPSALAPSPSGSPLRRPQSAPAGGRRARPRTYESTRLAPTTRARSHSSNLRAIAKMRGSASNTDLNEARLLRLRTQVVDGTSMRRPASATNLRHDVADARAADGGASPVRRESPRKPPRTTSPRKKKKSSRASIDMHQTLDSAALALASLRKERELLERDLQQLNFYGENVFKKGLPDRDTVKRYGTLEMIYLNRLRAIRAKAAGRVAM